MDGSIGRDVTGGSRVYVAGATGMVGSAIVRRLTREGITVLQDPNPREDLRSQRAAFELIDALRPDWLFLAAATVGGIYANRTYPADFIYDNLAIQNNVIQAAHSCKVKRLMFLGSACIYPRLCDQPIKEEYLLNGYLEPTNEAYAVAKIAGLVMTRSFNQQHGTDFISVMPTNLYGPGDNFDLESSHVVPALMRKAHEAKVSQAPFIEVWGTGNPRREFLHVDDLADACLFLMQRYHSDDHINVGTGSDISIKELVLMIKDVVGYPGEIRFQPQMPDGVPRRVLDVSRLKALGWKHSIELRDGIASTYRWYLENDHRVRTR